MLNKENIYLIGIGGIGMSALARYFKNAGKKVAGYDRSRTPLCEALENEDIPIHYEDDINLIGAIFRDKKHTSVIYTPAIPDSHTELNYFRAKGFDIYKRAQVLGILAKNHTCLAVAGTHGKTTTSALLAHLFYHSGVKTDAFLGGISVNYQTNFLCGDGSNDILIAEADEFDRSFLQLKPDGAVITSMDADHLDIYGNHAELEKSFTEFAESIVQHCIVQQDLPLKGKKYGLNGQADYRAENIRIENHNYYFDLISPSGQMENIKSNLPGRHNVENAVGAAALALLYGLSLRQVKAGIETFAGVRRRFEYHIRTKDLVYIDDYAHHPTEISALVNSVRELYPQKRITGIFQPHLYTRTRDFADDFAKSLSLLDELVLMEIYPAREKPIAGVNAGMLLEKVELDNKRLLSRQEILSCFREHKKEVVLTIGAGDIDQIINPLKLVLLNG